MAIGKLNKAITDALTDPAAGPSAIGPIRSLEHVRFSAAYGGKADIRQAGANRRC
jgi:hypothetical protein